MKQDVGLIERKKRLGDEKGKRVKAMSYSMLVLTSLASIPLYKYMITSISRRAAVYDLSALEVELEKHYNISTTQFGTILTAFYFANVATSMLASWLADYRGRRYFSNLMQLGRLS